MNGAAEAGIVKGKMFVIDNANAFPAHVAP